MYWRIVDADGKQATHLDGGVFDATLCGLSTSFDPLVHKKEPERSGPMEKCRVTCSICQQIIVQVKSHLKL